MSKKVTLINLTKNEIIIKSRKRKLNHVTISSFICCFVILAILMFGNLNDNFNKNILSVYSPVNSLYSDNSDIIFTNGNVSLDKLEFTIPIVGGGVENIGGSLKFTIGKSIMVRAIESGVVVDVGQTVDGVKYIKIKHSSEIYSVIENIDIVGVAEFESVKKGQDIATGKVGDAITLKIFKDDMQIKLLQVLQSKIICQE